MTQTSPSGQPIDERSLRPRRSPARPHGRRRHQHTGGRSPSVKRKANPGPPVSNIETLPLVSSPFCCQDLSMMLSFQTPDASDLVGYAGGPITGGETTEVVNLSVQDIDINLTRYFDTRRRFCSDCRCWSAWPDLRERWPARLVAQEAVRQSGHLNSHDKSRITCSSAPMVG